MSRVQPFQFEPSCPPCKEPIDQEESESGDTNQQDARGRIEWCSCKKCEAMATEEDCFCCQELAELNQKFDESGLFRGQKDYYLFLFVRNWMYYGARQIQDCLP